MKKERKAQLWQLIGRKQPLINVIPSKHTTKKPLLWWDEEKGYNREMRYATNQKSVFVDEQVGVVTLGRVVFRQGKLLVEPTSPQLMEFLDKHPLNGKLFERYDAVEEAQDDLAFINAQLQAMNLAKELEIDHVEAILRVELGSKVSNMSTKELKRDILLFSKSDPYNFLALAEDDNVELRNFGIKAVESGYITLTPDQRTFKWKSNGRKLFDVPLDEHPYSALAAYFKTDEGMEVLKTLEKKSK